MIVLCDMVKKMKPLHKRYSNLTPLAFKDNGNSFSIEYSGLTQIVKSGLTIIACLGAGIGVYLAVEDAFKVWFLAICVATAIGVALLTIFIQHKEKNKPPFMIFDSGSDVAKFPRNNEEIKEARGCLGFSHERYEAVKGGSYELNYVLEGQRHRFLSNVYSLKSIAQKLERKGFKVIYFDEFEK